MIHLYPLEMKDKQLKNKADNNLGKITNQKDQFQSDFSPFSKVLNDEVPILSQKR